MTQSLPDFGTGSASLAAAWDAIKQWFASLRSNFHGGTAPSGMVIGQCYFDGTKPQWWNGTTLVGAAGVSGVQRGLNGTLIAGGEVKLLIAAPVALRVDGVRVLTTAATTSDATNNVELEVTNQTQSLGLFSGGNPSTDGNEMIAYESWDQTPDQNQDLAQGDVLEVVVRSNGTGSLAFFSLELDMTAL